MVNCMCWGWWSGNMAAVWKREQRWPMGVWFHVCKCCDGLHTVFIQTGYTPLHWAAQYGHLHIVRELTEMMNADVLAQQPVCVLCVALSTVCTYNNLCIVSRACWCDLEPCERPPPCFLWWPLGDCQVPHAQIWRQQVWHGQPCSKLSPQGSDKGPSQGGAIPHWGGRVWSQS